MISLVSAATNGCVYCTSHHGALMRAETGDALFAEYLSRNYTLAPLSPRHRATLDFVVKVQKDAEHIAEADRQGLRDVGFDDEAIWRVISTAAFYASANRIAQATGLKTRAAIPGNVSRAGARTSCRAARLSTAAPARRPVDSRR